MDYWEIIKETLPFMTVFAVFLGMIVGSFVNVCVWRLPRGESLSSPGSHCPKCNHAIRPWENIPVISWLLLRGRCSNCRLPISIRYPLVEMATGVVFGVVWLRVYSAHLPLSLLPAYFFLSGALVAVTLIDLEFLIIPNKITFSGIGVALLLAVVFPQSHLPENAVLTGVFQDHLMVGWLVDGLMPVCPWLFHWPWALALLDGLVGILVGGGILWVILEAGKRIWGRRLYHVSEPVKAVLTPTGVVVGDAFQTDWDEIFFRRNDRFKAVATSIELQESEGADADSTGGTVSGELVVSRQWLVVDGRRLPWNKVTKVTAMVTQWSVPREVMGLGDLKFLAMVGAFLGGDACIFILMISAIIGSIIGVGLMVFTPMKRHVQLPFGPFLALGTFIWMLAGSNLLLWYGRWLTGLL